MKKIFFLFGLIAIAGYVHAQTPQAKSKSRSAIVKKDTIVNPQDNMPVAKPKDNSPMPVVKPADNAKMPVVNPDTNKVRVSSKPIPKSQKR